LKAFGLITLMGVVMGASVVILAKGGTLFAAVPFFANLGIGVWAFTKWGCLPSGGH